MNGGSRRSPWWYRNRAPVIGVAYALSFGSGSTLTQTLGQPLRPAIDALDGRYGTSAHRMLAVVAIAAVAGATALRIWGSSYLRAATVWNPDALNDRLIVAGPFAYVRNPLYLANVILAAGLGAFGTPFAMLFAVASNLAIGLGLASVERPPLHARFGAAFDAYVRAVPSLLPRASAWGDATPNVSPSLRSGIRSEAFMAIFLTGATLATFAYW